MTVAPVIPLPRLVSIDAFRAVIMILMIFVNDLWTLIDIPKWLDHVSADADGMGLADIVFPAFLFIVGLSVPYAIQNRRKKGDTTSKIFFHILSRSIALLVMGLFLVNAEDYAESAILPKGIWTILLIGAFFLIWMAYKNPESQMVKLLKIMGILLLVILAMLYKTNAGSGLAAMGIHWWGILGLIGWAYLIASCVYLFSGGKPIIQVAAFLFFMLFSCGYFLGWLAPIEKIKDYVWIVGDGAMPALSMAGIIASITYKKLTSANKKFWLIMVLFAVGLMVFGLVTRPIWGISKIKATPSWTAICSGISVIGFLMFVYITDLKKVVTWYKYIKPAGTSTLTCYLLPYIHYALIGLLGLAQLPEIMRTGVPGLFKSLIYALIIVSITGLLEKRNIRLKI
jgi:predicted acyltransferase